MRELKFRGWHAEDKVMVYDLNSLRLFHGVLVPDDYILMQYTGLKDKNNLDIYEGDFVLWDGLSSIAEIDHDMNGHIGKIMFIPRESSFRASFQDCPEKYRGEYTMLYSDRFMVKGNIYEHQNPELLEFKQ